MKVEIAVNGEVCDPLSFVSHSSKAVASGRSTALKLKEVLSRQQFEIILQAKVGQKVITLVTAMLFMMWISLHDYYHPSCGIMFYFLCNTTIPFLFHIIR